MERTIMYGSYHDQVCFCYRCVWLAVTLTLVQYNHTTDYIFPLDT
jgi:hypothetical protein